MHDWFWTTATVAIGTIFFWEAVIALFVYAIIITRPGAATREGALATSRRRSAAVHTTPGFAAERAAAYGGDSAPRTPSPAALTSEDVTRAPSPAAFAEGKRRAGSDDGEGHGGGSWSDVGDPTLADVAERRHWHDDDEATDDEFSSATAGAAVVPDVGVPASAEGETGGLRRRT